MDSTGLIARWFQNFHFISTILWTTRKEMELVYQNYDKLFVQSFNKDLPCLHAWIVFGVFRDHIHNSCFQPKAKYSTKWCTKSFDIFGIRNLAKYALESNETSIMAMPCSTTVRYLNWAIKIKSSSYTIVQWQRKNNEIAQWLPSPHTEFVYHKVFGCHKCFGHNKLEYNHRKNIEKNSVRNANEKAEYFVRFRSTIWTEKKIG